MDKLPDWVTAEVGRAAKRPVLPPGPRAKAARYDSKNRRIVVSLSNGCLFAFPPEQAQGLSGATAAQLGRVEVVGRGYGLHWQELDADLSVPGLLAGLFGSAAWMVEMGRRGGAATTAAKQQAARENGRKGGRPRKTA